MAAQRSRNGKVSKPVEDRIRQSSVKQPDGCWLWALRKCRAGYGLMTIEKRTVLAHRASYASFVGPLVADLTIDHLCRNRACVNPEHLEQVTRAENVRRAQGHSAPDLRKEFCAAGHRLDDTNSYRWRGAHYCKQCARVRTRLACLTRRAALSSPSNSEGQ